MEIMKIFKTKTKHDQLVEMLKTNKICSAMNDLHKWLDNPAFPQKIGFRSGTVIAEVQRMI